MSEYGGRVSTPDPYQPEAAIRLGISAQEARETRWGLVLVVFMRLLAAAWILQGLTAWAEFLVPASVVFDHQAAARTGAMVFFAVVDLVAAVGLWLATPWGGVLWLFAALSQIFVAIALPAVVAVAWVGVDIALILIYFALTWRAGHVASA